jgi:RpiR family glv operon transcriptional regulator
LTPDFFEATRETIRGLNQTERKLFDYVVKNMDEVKGMSIQKFAETQYLSTTTVFRFAKKLGFRGYAEFVNSLLVTAHKNRETILPNALLKHDYSESYLKNAIETMRVMSGESVDKVIELLSRNPDIYILTDDNSHPITQYSEKLFIGLGLHAYGPETSYQMHNLTNKIKSGDIIIALSYSGQDTEMIGFIEQVFLRERPFLLSITRADNNTLESLSDVNFYVFTEEIVINGMDLTSGVAMLMILERLVYAFLGNNVT